MPSTTSTSAPACAARSFLAALPGYDALLVRSQVQVDAEAIAAGTAASMVIGRAGVGVDNIDIAAATAAGIMVVNAPTGNTIAAAEHTLALLFALARTSPRPTPRCAAASGSDRRSPAASCAARRWASSAWARSAWPSPIGHGRWRWSCSAHDPFVTEEAAAHHGVRLVPLAEILHGAPTRSPCTCP